MKNASVKGFAWHVLPAILYSLLIYLISSLSNPPAPDFDLDWGDKINHAGAFGLMMLLAYRAVRWLYAERTRSFQIVVALCYCVLYGLLDEIHQSFVPNRHCDLLDLLADAVGAGVMALITANLRVTANLRESGRGKVR